MRENGVRKAYIWSAVYVVVALVLGVLVGGCLRYHKGTPPLEGELQGAEGAKLSLLLPFRRELGAIDTAEVRNGRFKFTKGELRGVYAFSIDGIGEWLVYLSDTPTRIYFGEEKPLLAQPYGDTLNWMLRENHRLVRELGAKMQEFSREYEASTVDGAKIAKVKLEALDAVWSKASAEFEREIKKLILSDMSNAVGVFLLRQYKDMYTPEELEKLREDVESYAALQPDDANALALLEYMERNKNLLVGATVPAVSGLLLGEGKQVRLDSLICGGGGESVLVQFWSVGDEQSDACVQELNRLVGMRGMRRLRVVGMCFARSREEAIDYIKEHRVEWPNVLVYSDISEQYNVWGGAHNFLYGADGRLQARDVSMDELESCIQGHHK